MLRRSYSTLRHVAMARKPPRDPLIVVLGATGTGKSQLAVDLAARFNGEIINGDAMQMYDGLPIITNKITAEEQQGIPHHLLGFIPLDGEPWQVGLFKKNAGRIIEEIRSRGRLPILVGGTHYYTQSLLFEDSLVTTGSGDEQDQPHLSNDEILKRFPILDAPTEVIHEKLKEVDPVMAQRWHPNERRKITRSLEIFLMTGKKASDIYNEQKERRNRAKSPNEDSMGDLGSQPAAVLDSTLLFWVHSEPKALEKRLDSRVDKMLEAGLLDEVSSMDTFLRDKARAGFIVNRGRGIWISIGWKEFEEYLAALATGTESQITVNNLLSLSIEQTKTATRQYARRQIKWIRLKLQSGLERQSRLERLYLLDGSDIAKWTDTVSHPAIDITGKFLAGNHLPVPSELSDAAKEQLSLDKSAETSLKVHHECELCHTITVTEDQWQKHLSSRTHRRLIKKGNRLARRGRSPSPESDRISAPAEAP